MSIENKGMNNVLRPSLVIMLFLLLFPLLSHAEKYKDSKVSYLDILLIKSSDDVRSYFLAMRLANKNNKNLIDYLSDGMSRKIDDLITFLPEDNNQKTITLVCDSQKRTAKQVSRFTNDCSSEIRLCEKVFYWGRVCASKEGVRSGTAAHKDK